ncbi:SAM-dependent methyltransferase [Streptacidiphilus jiangxiensis]|uniref:S-adenosyl methyltransferase n=1 Tax=Streptacidiphilus jiangxiensis TaxID=235985 RepID=A0A1H7QPE8_STRJI|nr:SAM-dependent methyltransferase [Streptacidiphilus jiangxiensis]SEL49890.1 S-adenosyl methyltransferase [Streptacidiphilus jiangxiensis]
MTRDPLPPGIDPGRPSIARVYDFFLGGTHHVEADREVARRIADVMPDFPTVVRHNRAFVRRAVRYLLDEGVRQFVDLGSGLATAGAVHLVAQEFGADARVLYVDSDPTVAADNRSLVPAATAGSVAADLRDPASVLDCAEARRLLDLDRPTALLMIAVLHFVPHRDDPAGVVAGYREAVASGSFVALTHAEDASRVPGTFEAARLYSQDVAQIHLRSRTEIADMLRGWELVAPGLVATPAWRPDPEVVTPPTRLNGLAAVGRKP